MVIIFSTYKYEIGNCFLNSKSYLLDNHLSYLQLKQHSMAYLNQCLLFNTKETQKCCIRKLNPSFLFDLHHGMVTNEHQYVTKMALCATMGGLWGDFNAIFWIAEYFTKVNLYLE
jgi:hypothetical protein